MAYHLKDLFFKEMVEHHPEHYIDLLQPQMDYEVISTKLDKELIVRRRETDFLEDNKMKEHWEQVPIFGDHIKQRYQEGKREGEREGKREGIILNLRENIMEAITLRFGQVNGDIERQVNRMTDPNKLRNLFRLIIKANSLDEFKKALMK